MTPLALALGAGLGSYLLLSRNRSRTPRRTPTDRVDLDAWLHRAGVETVDRREFLAVLAGLFVAGVVAGYIAFGGVGPPIAIGAFGASIPVAGHRSRIRARRQRALEAWPRLIDELRVQTSSLGRSIPQALFDAGGRSPDELRPAFDAAHREWLLTTDFPRALGVLKERLSDSTADMACETLLVAQEIGGTDLDRRLEALAHDRFDDVQCRKDAHARQASARFARKFVVIVPAGMAFAGMSIGDGRAAYRSPVGQVVVLVAIALVAMCWVWAGRVLHLPDNGRVFTT